MITTQANKQTIKQASKQASKKKNNRNRLKNNQTCICIVLVQGSEKV